MAHLEPTRATTDRPTERLVQLHVHRSDEVTASLANELSSALRGEVRFDAGSRSLYATDGSNYRQVPIGVVIPRDDEDVRKTLELCRQHGAPVLPRGGGTSLAGQCCNVAVVIDFSKYMSRLLSMDRSSKSAHVQPGLVLDELRKPANELDLTFGPDPSTHNRCTMGGMIGNNSCGVHSVMSGRTSENVNSLRVLTYDGLEFTVGPTSEEELGRLTREPGRRGEIYRGLVELRDTYSEVIRARYPKIPRRVSGYNLDELLPERGFNVARALVGTEGTCVTVLEAEVRLIDWPRAHAVVVLGYPDIYQAGDDVLAVMAHGPIGLEAIDDELRRNIQKKHLHVNYLNLLPKGKGWLIAELGGDTQREADDKARALMDALGRRKDPPSMKMFDNAADEAHVWRLRESGLGATARVPGEPDTWEGWEDSAVPPAHLGEYLRKLHDAYHRYGYTGALYGHFGQGCVHTRVNFDLYNAEGIARYRSFMEEMADLVVSLGGSLSGEHGDGQSRAELLPRMFGTELVGAMRSFKRLWDPREKMNPHKVVDPYPIDSNLRIGADYEPAEPETHFQFPNDEGSMARATLRCVGVGLCRRHEGGTMCPSYMVTREEEHSTRGRAHLLFEMLRGDDPNRFHNEDVKRALDLCLACKGCLGDCPVNVDVATYKAEFLSHYYEGKLRPRAAYAMGLIERWVNVARIAPGIANFTSQTAPLSALFKHLGGIAQERQVPRFAARTFKQEWMSRGVQNANGSPVLLWPDTFNNQFFPGTAMAAATSLEALGYRVIVPQQRLCCGRPLYDYGFLDQAKRQLRQILRALREPIERGIPLIALEPSCLAVFRDELHNLFPRDQDAARLTRQSYLLSEFLEQKVGLARLPRVHAAAIVQGHCHQGAIAGMSSEEAAMRALGLDVEILDSGCCGMAGSFGFEADKYDISRRCGERVLLPRVREAGPDTLIIADGFSCREQIRQGSSRQALHLAEVLKRALDGAESVARGPAPYVESRVRARDEHARPNLKKAALWGALALGLGLAALSRSARRRTSGRGARARG